MSQDNKSPRMVGFHRDPTSPVPGSPQKVPAATVPASTTSTPKSALKQSPMKPAVSSPFAKKEPSPSAIAAALSPKKKVPEVQVDLLKKKLQAQASPVFRPRSQSPPGPRSPSPVEGSDSPRKGRSMMALQKRCQALLAKAIYAPQSEIEVEQAAIERIAMGSSTYTHLAAQLEPILRSRFSDPQPPVEAKHQLIFRSFVHGKKLTPNQLMTVFPFNTTSNFQNALETTVALMKRDVLPKNAVVELRDVDDPLPANTPAQKDRFRIFIDRNRIDGVLVPAISLRARHTPQTLDFGELLQQSFAALFTDNLGSRLNSGAGRETNLAIAEEDTAGKAASSYAGSALGGAAPTTYSRVIFSSKPPPKRASSLGPSGAPKSAAALSRIRLGLTPKPGAKAAAGGHDEDGTTSELKNDTLLLHTHSGFSSALKELKKHQPQSRVVIEFVGQCDAFGRLDLSGVETVFADVFYRKIVEVLAEVAPQPASMRRAAVYGGVQTEGQSTGGALKLPSKPPGGFDGNVSSCGVSESDGLPDVEPFTHVTIALRCPNAIMATARIYRRLTTGPWAGVWNYTCIRYSTAEILQRRQEEEKVFALATGGTIPEGLALKSVDEKAEGDDDDEEETRELLLPADKRWQYEMMLQTSGAVLAARRYAVGRVIEDNQGTVPLPGGKSAAAILEKEQELRTPRRAFSPRSVSPQGKKDSPRSGSPSNQSTAVSVAAGKAGLKEAATTFHASFAMAKQLMTSYTLPIVDTEHNICVGFDPYGFLDAPNPWTDDRHDQLTHFWSPILSTESQEFPEMPPNSVGQLTVFDTTSGTNPGPGFAAVLRVVGGSGSQKAQAPHHFLFGGGFVNTTCWYPFWSNVPQAQRTGSILSSASEGQMLALATLARLSDCNDVDINSWLNPHQIVLAPESHHCDIKIRDKYQRLLNFWKGHVKADPSNGLGGLRHPAAGMCTDLDPNTKMFVLSPPRDVLELLQTATANSTSKRPGAMMHKILDELHPKERSLSIAHLGAIAVLFAVTAGKKKRFYMFCGDAPGTLVARGMQQVGEVAGVPQKDGRFRVSYLHLPGDGGSAHGPGAVLKLVGAEIYGVSLGSAASARAGRKLARDQDSAMPVLARAAPNGRVYVPVPESIAKQSVDKEVLEKLRVQYREQGKPYFTVNL